AGKLSSRVPNATPRPPFFIALVICSNSSPAAATAPKTAALPRTRRQSSTQMAPIGGSQADSLLDMRRKAKGDGRSWRSGGREERRNGGRGAEDGRSEGTEEEERRRRRRRSAENEERSRRGPGTNERRRK